MKKYLLLAAFGGFVLGSTAQNAPYHQKQDPAQMQAKARTLPLVGWELPTNTAAQHPGAPYAASRSYTETVIGHSYYDTQTNGVIQHRMIKDGDDLYAAWTMSQEPSFTDRGTGYVTYSPNSWAPEPLERIENVRVGWPNLLKTGGGRILSITHSGDPYHLILTYMDEGDTEWSQMDIPTDLPSGLLWGHACLGGDDMNTIHIVGLATPTAFGGVEVDGQDGTMRYFRSSDQGDTWEVTDFLIPGTGSDDLVAVGPDNYDIHARGDRVAVGLFNDWADSFIFISEDGGDNWNSTKLFDFPVDLHPVDEELLDMNEDMLADTAFSTDGSGQVYLDTDGQAHACWSDMFYLDDVLGDGNWSYFPGVDGVNYWNETYGPDSSQYVGYLIDADESGEFDFAEDLAAYGTGSTSHSQIAEDDMGNIYIVYAGIVETHATGTQNYRHIFATKTEDGGVTFSEPVDVTPDIEFIYYEYAFPSMAEIVDDRLHIVAQRDAEPGTSLTDSDPVVENDIVYLGIDTDFDVSEVTNVAEEAKADFNVYPNPANQTVFVIVEDMTNVNVDLFDITGKLVTSQQQTQPVAQYDISVLAPGMYTIAVTNNGVVSTQKLIVQ